MKKLYFLFFSLCINFGQSHAQTFSVTPTPTVINGGYTVQATITSTVSGVTSYSWNVSGGSGTCTPSQTVSSGSGTTCLFTFPCCTNYTITCYPMTGNTAGAPIAKTVLCGSQTTNLANHTGVMLQLYPNPCSGVLTLKGMPTASEFILRNPEGKILLQQQLDSDSEIDLKAYSLGLYFYSLNATIQGKLILE